MIWHDNTEYVCKKGYECLWMLMRLRSLGASESELVDVYEKQIKSFLELALPVWQTGPTKLKSN